MAKLKIGDIVEIATSRGFAYAQFTHKHKSHGALLRVFETVYTKRPASLNELMNQNIRFFCFFPLSYAVDKKIVAIVGNISIPPKYQSFPIFRAGVIDPATKKVSSWWLWDGENEWMVGNLTTEQRKLPIRGVWNDTLLLERIESNWSPESDDT